MYNLLDVGFFLVLSLLDCMKVNKSFFSPLLSYYHGSYRAYALYQPNSLQRGKQVDKNKYYFHAEKKYINFAAKRDDEISLKTLAKKANKHNLISNNVNFWKKGKSINIEYGISYLHCLYIINIFCYKITLNGFELILESLPSNIGILL